MGQNPHFIDYLPQIQMISAEFVVRMTVKGGL